MKKQVLLTLLLAIIANASFANFINGNWRWRNNDGNETAATWRANQNTSIEVVSRNEVLRLRIEVYSSDKAVVNNAELQWSTSGATGTWSPLTTSTEVNPFAIATTNSFLTKNEPTTQRLVSAWPTSTYTSGIVMYDRDNINLVINGAVKIYEHEVVLIPTNNMQGGQTYYFRFYNSEESKSANIPYASLTTAGTLPIQLKNLSIKTTIEGNRVEWTTSSEINNKYFTLERSNNGIDWVGIADIAGNGTTNNQSDYSFLDKNPLKGINYYRLAQYDNDGKVNYSGVSSANFNFTSSDQNIYPVPFTNQFHVNLIGYNGKAFETRLTNVLGQEVYKSKLVANENGIDVQLNSAPKPGVYILNIKGNGINLVKQVSVK